MSSALEVLLDKQAITEVIYRYCRAYDRMDMEMAIAVWHPGGTVAYGDAFDGPVTEYLPGSWAYRAGLANFSHQVTNILITVDGESAGSEAYVTASLQQHPAEGRVQEDLYRGRYVDRWSKRDGRWAIDHRQFIPDSFTRTEFDAALLRPGFLALGRKSRTDPSYAVLGD